MSMNTNTNDTTTPSTETAFFNEKELAVYLQCNPVTVRRLVRRGALPVIRLGGRLLFRKSEVEAALQRHTVPAVGMRRARA